MSFAAVCDEHFYVVKINTRASHSVDFCSCKIDIHYVHVAQHRRGWIEEELFRLCSIFSIDLMGYAVMSNHYHAIFHIDAETAEQWCVDEVIDRWGQLYTIPEIVTQYQSGEISTSGIAIAVDGLVEQWRQRLCSLSWLM